MPVLVPEPVVEDDIDPDEYRPQWRHECVDAPRPCPFAGCEFHALLVVLPSGRLQFPHGHEDPTLLPEDKSCALDVADKGGVTLEEVGQVLGITRERTRQIVDIALVKVRRTAAHLELRAAARRAKT